MATTTPANGTNLRGCMDVQANCKKEGKTCVTVNMAEEKVEMSEVPLTEEATKTGATTDTATAAEMAATKEPTAETKKTTFTMPKIFKREHRSKSKETKVETAGEMTDAAKEKENLINGDSPKKDAAATTKPKRQWFKRKCPAETAEGTDAAETKPCDTMTIGLNMIDRDEKNINESVKLQFDDIFGEPEGYHVPDCAWRTTFRVFNGTRNVCYKILATIFFIPCAIIWGLLFALLACLNVWTCVPTAKCMGIIFGWVFKMWAFIVRALFDPIFRSIGLCCGAITVRRHTVVEPRVEIMQMA